MYQKQLILAKNVKKKFKFILSFASNTWLTGILAKKSEAELGTAQSQLVSYFFKFPLISKYKQ